MRHYCGLGGQTLTPSEASRAGLVSPLVPTWYSRSVNPPYQADTVRGKSARPAVLGHGPKRRQLMPPLQLAEALGRAQGPA